MIRRLAPGGYPALFEDLGFSLEEAANLKVRSVLMAALRTWLEGEGITQGEAAERFGVTQPRVSDLVRGKIELFSIDTLVNMLGAVGQRGPPRDWGHSLDFEHYFGGHRGEGGQENPEAPTTVR